MKKVIFLCSLFFIIGCKPKIFDAVSASFAKEYCSCLFVEKQEKNYCLAYAKQMIPINRFEVQDNKVKVWALGLLTTATFYDQRQGCQLTSYQEAF